MVLGSLVRGATITQAAEQAGIDRTTVYRWQKESAVFVAELNRAKSEQLRAIQEELRDLASQAVKTLRDFVSSDAVSSSVKLRTALAILQASGCLKPEGIGSTDPEKIERDWEQARLFESLTALGLGNGENTNAV